MTPDHANDPLLRALARLPAAAPDEARASRVRARCHAGLERARSDRDRPVRRLTPIQLFEAAVVGGVCLFYLSTVIHEVVRLHGPG